MGHMMAFRATTYVVQLDSGGQGSITRVQSLIREILNKYPEFDTQKRSYLSERDIFRKEVIKNEFG